MIFKKYEIFSKMFLLLSSSRFLCILYCKNNLSLLKRKLIQMCVGFYCCCCCPIAFAFFLCSTLSPDIHGRCRPIVSFSIYIFYIFAFQSHVCLSIFCILSITLLLLYMNEACILYMRLILSHDASFHSNH